MSWVDLVVIALAIIAGISGWRHGMAVALLSFVGVLGGAILGVRLAPLLAVGVENPNSRVVVSIIVVVLLVALGETTGVFFGRRIRDRITGERSLRVDSTLGSVLQAITVVLAAWLVALPLASASFPGLAAGVRGSTVLGAVDTIMPAGAKQLPSELRQLLDSPAVTAVASSVLKVRGRAPSCRKELEGTGFVVGPQLVMTNAHVVAGTSEVAVEVRGRRGAIVPLDATVVLYDPSVDVAVLRVPDLDAEPMTLRANPADTGDDAIVLGYPLDGPFTVTAGRVRQNITLKGPDIYEGPEVVRDVYTVRARVQSGNSGGPMIDTSGQVIGVVFGAALDDAETGFVLTVKQVAPALEAANGRTRGVKTGACAA